MQKVSKVTTIRLNDGDIKRLRRLQCKLGGLKAAQVIRVALAMLEERLESSKR